MASLLALHSSLAADQRPNFVFLFSDDQSYEALHAAGNEVVQTPHLDRLAQEGTRFANAYNMGSWTGAVCVASRTMLVTGRSVWRAQEAQKGLDEMATRDELWPQLLERAGYETCFSGKWHIKIDPEKVFRQVRHPRGGMPDQTPEGYQRPVEGEPDAWSPYAREFGGFWEGGKHWTEVVADDAEFFLKDAARHKKPFFLYLAFNAPHDPRQSPKRFVDLYPPEDIPIPASYRPEYPYKQEIGCYLMPDGNTGKQKLQRDEKVAPWPRTEHAVRVHRGEYYAIVSHLDEQIGRILEALEQSGLSENTYVIFTSDHGLACGNHGLMGKQNMYEHSMRAPFLIAGPGVPKGELREGPIYLQSVMPTTLDLAGISKPDFVEFDSLTPSFTGEGSGLDSVYGAYRKDIQRMIRIGDYKLIVYPQAGLVRLFNLREDPHELRDLASDPSQWPRIRNMFQELLLVQQKMGDPLRLQNHFPELAEASR